MIKTIKATKAGKEGSVEYVFGNSLAENVELFGEEHVNSGFLADTTLSIQARIRAALDSDRDMSEVASWKPGDTITRRPQDALVAAKKKFAGMSQEEKLAFLEQLQNLA